MNFNVNPLLVVCLSLVAIFLIISQLQETSTLTRKDAQIQRLKTQLAGAKQRLSDTKKIGPIIWSRHYLEIKTNMTGPEFLDLLTTWLKEENLDVVIHKGESK